MGHLAEPGGRVVGRTSLWLCCGCHLRLAHGALRRRTGAGFRAKALRAVSPTPKTSEIKRKCLSRESEQNVTSCRHNGVTLSFAFRAKRPFVGGVLSSYPENRSEDTSSPLVPCDRYSPIWRRLGFPVSQALRSHQGLVTKTVSTDHSHPPYGAIPVGLTFRESLMTDIAKRIFYHRSSNDAQFA